MNNDTSGVIGCLAALVVIALVVAGIIYLPGMKLGGTADSPAAESKTAPSSLPLTRAAPVADKQVVEKAAKVDPMARKIKTEDEPPPEQTPVQPSRTIAAVQDLAIMAPPPSLPPVAGQAADQALAAEALCYKGRRARQVRSLFNAPGYAITFGSDSFADGDPYPRLEVFYNLTRTPPEVSALSITPRDIPEFPQNREIPVPYSAEAISSVIAKWLAAVATETCPASPAKTSKP